LSSTPARNAQELSKEGREQKAIHDYLFDTFVEGRETEYVAAGRHRGLKEVTILLEMKEIRHGDEVLLPPGAPSGSPVSSATLPYTATNSTASEKYTSFPFSPDKAPPGSQQVKDFDGVQTPSIPPSDQSPERTKIRFLMKDKDHLKEYYGNVEWAVRSIFAGTPGWFDGNPTNPFSLPIREEAEPVTKELNHVQKRHHRNHCS
jgi:agarase